MSMMPSVASAGKKTIKDRRNSGDISQILVEVNFGWSVALAGQRRAPEQADQEKYRYGPDHNEHYVLPDASGLNRVQTGAERIDPSGKQVHEAIDDRLIGDEIPCF